MADVLPQKRMRAGHVNPPSVVDEILAELRFRILSGSLGPGVRIVEERLTTELGVSRAPLREALRILERDGLVSSQPRRGAIVTRLTADDVREIYSLRWALERLAVELAVPLLNRESLVPLRGALEKMRVAAESGDVEGVVRANAAFHMAIVDLAGHRRLEQAYRVVAMQLEMCMAVNLRFRAEQYPDKQDSFRRHEGIFQLIEAGDRDAVLHELRAHGQNAFMDRLEDLISGQE